MFVKKMQNTCPSTLTLEGKRMYKVACILEKAIWPVFIVFEPIKFDFLYQKLFKCRGMEPWWLVLGGISLLFLFQAICMYL